jgi:hypothetical protein
MYFMELNTIESKFYLKQKLAKISHNNIQSVTFSVNKIFLDIPVVSIV